MFYLSKLLPGREFALNRVELVLGNPSRNFHLLAWLTLVMTISAHSQSFQADAERFVTTFAEQKSFQGVILVARSGQVLILELVVWQAGRMVDQFLDGNLLPRFGRLRMYRVTGASRPSFSRLGAQKTAAPVNCLIKDANSNFLSRVFGMAHSPTALPQPFESRPDIVGVPARTPHKS